MKNKILQIDIIGDATKFLKSLSEVQKEAKSTKAIVDGVGNTVDTSGIDKLSGKLGELGGKARGAKSDVENNFKPILDVDTSKVTTKLNNIEGDAKSTKTAIENQKAEIQLSIEMGKSQLEKLKGDYKAAKNDMEAKVQISLDISDVTNKINDAKQKIRELDGVKPKVSLSDSIAQGVEKGNSAAVGGGIKAAGLLAIADKVVGNMMSQDTFEKQLVENGMSAGNAKEEVQFAFKSAAKANQTTDQYINYIGQYAKATGQDLGRLNSDEKSSIASQLGLLETQGYSVEESLSGVMSMAKKKNKTPQEVLLTSVGAVSSKGFTDNQKDLMTNLSEFTQVFGDTKSMSEIFNIALESSRQGQFSLNNTYDANKELTPVLNTILNDGTGGMLKELNRITGKEFGDLIKQYKNKEINMEDLQGKFVQRVGNLTNAQSIDMIQNGLKMPLAEDTGPGSLMALLGAGHLDPNQEQQLGVQLLAQGQKKTQELKSIGGIQKGLTMTTGALGSFMTTTGGFVLDRFTSPFRTEGEIGRTGTEDFTQNTKYLDLTNPNGEGIQEQVANINKTGTTVNSNSTVINNYYGQESIDSQSQKENIKSGQTGYEWLKSRGKIK